MFFIPVYNHQCSPIPIEEIASSEPMLRHSENSAGFDVYEIKSKVAQCPVCKKKHQYDQKATKVGFQTYDGKRAG